MAIINLSRDELACIRETIEYHGCVYQSMLAVEEMSELQKELIKSYRGKLDIGKLTEELADVIIMLRQVQEVYAITDEELIDVINLKCRRTNRRIEDEKKDAKIG